MERIVVGVDGSETAALALRWAADEARRRNATVEAVLAWADLPLTHHAYIEERESEVGRRYARRVLDAAVDAVDTTGIPPVDRRLVGGGAARALIKAAEGAALLVVGSRGLGGFSGLLLGSVGRQAAHRAPCPVVIIPAAERSHQVQEPRRTASCRHPLETG